jgi:adenylyl cyclase-associated protein
MEKLISRLEAVTARLESVAIHAGDAGASSASDSGALAPSVAAYDVIVDGAFSKFLGFSQKIGGDVQTQVELVKQAFSAQHDFLIKVSKCKEPPQSSLPSLLQPTSEKISATQEFREKHRTSPLFNHLSAISESIPALGWVTIAPAPGPYIREMVEASQFFTNRVLKDYKEKDATHVDWVKSWIAVLTELQAFVKQFYTTGLQWNKQGVDVSSFNPSSPSKKPCGAPPPPCGGAPPPPPPGPPPPPVATDAPSGGGGADESKAALFSELNKGEDITKSLKKVSDDKKTHKNPALRFNAPQPFKPQPSAKPGVASKPGNPPHPVKQETKKPPKIALEGKKWNVEYHHDNKNIIISETEMKQTVYIFKCDNCTIQVKGKVNAITMDGCKKSALVFEESISSVDFINCQSVQAQVLGKVPTVSIDKTDGCMIYLSKDSLHTQIVTAKSSEMNVLVPDASGEFKEFAIPEQFRTCWNGSKLVTEMTDIKVG